MKKIVLITKPIMEKTMKKIIIPTLLFAIAGTSWGMVPYQAPQPGDDALKFVTLAFVGTVGIMAGAGAYMYSEYLRSQQPRTKKAAPKIHWAPYGKIATGLALVGTSIYLGKQNQEPAVYQEMHYAQNSGSGDNINVLPVMINFGSLYSLAPLLPAYFFLKSGFEDLRK